MPVSGASNQFGTRRNADIRWQGWLIPAAEGEPIRAVHAGRVIYADWLRGQGLLIVIDHNDGWLTLYAQNHSLMRQVGDRVIAGDVIARAGASGGRGVTGLYFEIRRKGNQLTQRSGYGAERSENNRYHYRPVCIWILSCSLVPALLVTAHCPTRFLSQRRSLCRRATRRCFRDVPPHGDNPHAGIAADTSALPLEDLQMFADVFNQIRQVTLSTSRTASCLSWPCKECYRGWTRILSS